MWIGIGGALAFALGKSDEKHIIRTIEYWDIERKRYPQYDHCAVIVAEDITSRFLNVVSLFNGQIPIIAIQMHALTVADHLTLAFTLAWKETLGEQLKGEFPSLESTIRFLLQQLNCPMYSEGLDSAMKRRLAVEQASLRPRSDALAALTCLRSRGLRIGVITNCSRETVDAWSSSELSCVVDHCAFSCVVGSVKPDPIIYLHACSALSIDPGECLFVADGSNEELEGAIRVGMDAVLIRGFDDDGSFPGRIERDHWTGAFVSALSEVPTLV